jgi:hypothetical protein
LKNQAREFTLQAQSKKGMPVPDWLSHLSEEWKLITAAPVISIIFVLVVVGVVWAVQSWANKSRLESKDGEISLLQRQVNDYKDKLSGASPDEAKAKIAELEARVSSLADELRPRTLTDKQRELLIQSLAMPSGKRYVVSVAHDMACTDGKRLANQFSAIFQTAGAWNVNNPSVMGLSNPPPSGLGVLINNASSPTDAENLVIRALQRAGLAFDIQQVSRGPRHPGIVADDVGIMITTKA